MRRMLMRRTLFGVHRDMNNLDDMNRRFRIAWRLDSVAAMSFLDATANSKLVITSFI